jgi:type III restriction enzyme
MNNETDLGSTPPNAFFEHPILNSPYDFPPRHWELDETGQPTQKVVESRRSAKFITPIPKPKKRKAAAQTGFVFDEGLGLSTATQAYDPTPIINEVRLYVEQWRNLRNPNQGQVTAETARLLEHWRNHDFSSVRPFFCQVEAVETAIWLTEVASNTRSGQRILKHLAAANRDANPDLMRLALKLATGAGKTTVMAMIIAWQTVNAVRHPTSNNFTRGFLVCAPGLTIKDRLRVLQPADPDSYYIDRELVPSDMFEDVKRAKIVITNYHAFKRRERVELSKGGRQLLQGRTGDELDTLETEGQMIQRVMPDLMGLKNIMVINDEAHHCYREKPDDGEEEDLKGDEKKEAEKNKEAARLWISGIEAVNRKLKVTRVLDLSATPFFLSGSGYAEGTLFPWTMSDFSLMDASNAASSSCRASPSPRTFLAPKCRCSGTSGRISAKTCRRRGAARARTSIRSNCRPDCRRRCKPSTAITRRRSSYGTRRASKCPRASSSSARTRRSRSSSTISFPASSARIPTALRPWKMAVSPCSGISTTSPAIRCRAPTRS